MIELKLEVLNHLFSERYTDFMHMVDGILQHMDFHIEKYGRSYTMETKPMFQETLNCILKDLLISPGEIEKDKSLVFHVMMNYIEGETDEFFTKFCIGCLVDKHTKYKA